MSAEPPRRPSDEGQEAAANRRTRLATRVGWVVAIGFVLLMAAGSDKPPPPGFLLFVGYGAGLAVLVRWALPRVLAHWDARGAWGALVRVAVAGFLLGTGLWALTSAVSTGEPSVPVSASSRLIGFVVVGTVGLIGAVLIASVGRMLDRRSAGRTGRFVQ